MPSTGGPETPNSTDGPETPNSKDDPETPNFQRFRVATHKVLLQEAIEKLTGMLDRIDECVARLSQRTKERLTRRVLDAKDIYLRDLDRRIFIAPEEWAKIVNYRPWPGRVTGPPKTKSVMRREEKYGDRSTWAQREQVFKAGSTPQWLHEKLVTRSPRAGHRVVASSEEAESFASTESEVGKGDEDDVHDRKN